MSDPDWAEQTFDKGRQYDIACAHVRREDDRSRVRRVLSYMAGGFVYVGGGVMTGYLLYKGMYVEAAATFAAVTASAGTVIGFWFATRSEDRKHEEK